MGVDVTAMVTYGWKIPYNLFYHRKENCPAIITNELCDTCALYGETFLQGTRPVLEEDLYGYYYTLHGYPVWGKDNYTLDPPFAYIGLTVSQWNTLQIDEYDFKKVRDALAPLLGYEGYGIHCWLRYS